MYRLVFKDGYKSHWTDNFDLVLEGAQLFNAKIEKRVDTQEKI